MSDQKRCPLKASGISTIEGKVKSPILLLCDEEHCAWWIEADNKCSIPVIARNLELIDCRIDSLVGVVDRK